MSRAFFRCLHLINIFWQYWARKGKDGGKRALSVAGWGNSAPESASEPVYPLPKTATIELRVPVSSGSGVGRPSGACGITYYGGKSVIKGIQRETVHLRTAEHPYFEEAYFVLRTDYGRKNGRDGDMIAEANRILESCGYGTERRGRGSGRTRAGGRGILGFFLGFFGGSAAVGLVWLLVVLL